MSNAGANRCEQPICAGKSEGAPRGEVNETVYRPAAWHQRQRQKQSSDDSGNVIFSSADKNVTALIDQVERMMQRELGLDIPVFIIPQEELADILRHAPDWWGTENKGNYDNLIFILPPATFPDIYYEIGAPKEGLEQIQEYQSAVFWSFSRKDYQKTNWWSKTARADIGSKLTIRTANTVRRIVDI